MHIKRNEKLDFSFGSPNEYVELQAKAYYLAMKQLESEKKAIKSIEIENQSTNKSYEKQNFIKILLKFFNIIFLPWKIFGTKNINNRVYDSILLIPISALLVISESVLWLAGVTMIFFMLRKLYFSFNMNTITFSFFLIVMGSFMILSERAFSKERDSMKIYAYSASVISLISCVISIITLALNCSWRNKMTIP